MKSSRTFLSHFSARLLSGFIFTFVVLLTSTLTIVFADTNPPLANPPLGNVYPKFSNLETAGDVMVGGFLGVGNSIRPNGGNSITLQADKIIMTKDFEAAEKGTAKYFIGDSVTAKNILSSNTQAFLNNVEISGNVTMKNGSTGYSSFNNINATGLNLSGPLQNSQGAVFDPTTDKDPVSVPDNLALQGNISFVDYNDPTNEMGSIKNEHVQEWSSVLDGLISIAGQVGTRIENVLFVGAMQGGSPTITTKERLLADGAKPDATLVVDFSTLSAEHIKAKSVGDYYFSNDKPVSVASGGTTTKVAYCPDASYQMLSCSVRHFNPSDLLAPLPTPNIYKGKSFVEDYHIDRFSEAIQFCTATVWNQYDSNFLFSVQATCFNPNK